MANRRFQALLLVWLMLVAPLAGCFGEDEVDGIRADALEIVEVDALQGGMWQQITLVAKEDLAVYIPYFIQDPGSLRAQNGTVLDLNQGERVSVNVLFPPRNDEVVFSSVNSDASTGRFEAPINRGWLGLLKATKAVPSKPFPIRMKGACGLGWWQGTARAVTSPP